ncbi:hypothetical protein [Pedobacter africanus]|uniref:Uncharacterized protein n=1 Tax=Pedobacter africanus TaxID=151894 RepID=A0A1W1ZDW9_9SPHI|nr:hypothetical protein [Pedobacter africanus]SMC46248.1 hypothetical protein SAMN04488524_0607 [Pedobacter africanus]
MTFKTDKQNEFKKDPLRGLEYRQDHNDKPFPFVQVFLYILVIMCVVICVKMCKDKPEPVSMEQLNADRR